MSIRKCLRISIAAFIAVTSSCGNKDTQVQTNVSLVSERKNIFEYKISLPEQGDNEMPILSYCTESTFDFGKVYDDTIITKSFWFKNIGNYPLLVLDYSANCQCTNMDIDKNYILPSDSARVTLVLSTTNKKGHSKVFAKLITNTELKFHKFVLKGEVLPRK